MAVQHDGDESLENNVYSGKQYKPDTAWQV